jgi:hypothetical protein
MAPLIAPLNTLFFRWFRGKIIFHIKPDYISLQQSIPGADNLIIIINDGENFDVNYR